MLVSHNGLIVMATCCGRVRELLRYQLGCRCVSEVQHHKGVRDLSHPSRCGKFKAVCFTQRLDPQRQLVEWPTTRQNKEMWLLAMIP